MFYISNLMSVYNNASRRIYPYSLHSKVEQYCKSQERKFFPDFIIKCCQPSPKELYGTTASDVYVAGSCNDLKQLLRAKLYSYDPLSKDDLFTIRHCIKQIGHHQNIDSSIIKKSIEKTIKKFHKLCEPVIEFSVISRQNSGNFEIVA